MTSIIVVLPKLDDSKTIKNLLVRNGFQVAAVCGSGSQAISVADNLDDGIVICGYKLVDMMYSELHDYLPPGFEMLLMASSHLLAECVGSDIMSLSMPLKLQDLLNTVELMTNSIEYKRKKRKSQPRTRKPEEIALINEAKALLMSRNNMTEEEAHRYIQKCSMDSSTNLVETAQMVLAVMQ